jgi:hypothetical protein
MTNETPTPGNLQPPADDPIWVLWFGYYKAGLKGQPERVQQQLREIHGETFGDFLFALASRSFRIVSEIDDDRQLWYRLEFAAADGYAGLARVHGSRLFGPDELERMTIAEAEWMERRDALIAAMVPDDPSELTG